jgi:hypothetical protein
VLYSTIQQIHLYAGNPVSPCLEHRDSTRDFRANLPQQRQIELQLYETQVRVPLQRVQREELFLGVRENSLKDPHHYHSISSLLKHFIKISIDSRSQCSLLGFVVLQKPLQHRVCQQFR